MRIFKRLLFLSAAVFFCTTARAQTSINGRITVAPLAARTSNCSPGDTFNQTDSPYSTFVCGPTSTWTTLAGGTSNILNTDNTFQLPQRFKDGPFIDPTAYMPAGGCDTSGFNGNAVPDPAGTGAITNASHTLTFTPSSSGGINDSFLNGCGIAVDLAGPLSSALPPHAGAAITSFASSAGGAETSALCATDCGFDPSYPANSVFGVQLSGCSDSAYNGTWPSSSGIAIPDSTHVVFIKPWTASTSGCTFTALFGYVSAGSAGSTEYLYKIATVDAYNGLSAASTAIDVTNGPTTLSPTDYITIQFDPKPEKWFLIYRASPIPLASVTDNFNRGSLGANWVVPPSGVTFGGVAPTITANQIAGNTSTTHQIAYYNPSTTLFSSDQTNSITYTGTTGSSGSAGVAIGARWSDSGGYQCFWFGGMVYIQRYGSFANLTSISSTLSNGNKIQIVMSGSTITCKIDSGSGFTTVLSTTDSTFTSGAPAFDSYGTGAFTTLDNFIADAPASSDYSYVGATNQNAWVDKGWNSIGRPAWAPSLAPSSAAHQTLYTTIASGGGTNTLTLTGTASATVTTSAVHHDDSSFINQALTVAAADAASPFGAGTSGVRIPSGNYFLEGPTLLEGSTQGTLLEIAGSLTFQSRPWFLTQPRLTVRCIGAGGGTSSFQDFETCPQHFSSNVPLGIVVKGTQIDVSGLDATSVYGWAFWIEGAGIHVEKSNFGTVYDAGATHRPPPFTVGPNSFGAFGRTTFDRIQVTSNGAGNASIAFSDWVYSQNPDANMSGNFSTAFGNVLMECPGCANSPTGAQAIYLTLQGESTCNGCSIVDFDNRLSAPSNPGRFELFNVSVNGQMADASTTSVFHAFSDNTTNNMNGVSGYGANYLASCGPNAQFTGLAACTQDTFTVTGYNGSGTTQSGLPINGTGYAIGTSRWDFSAIPLHWHTNGNIFNMWDNLLSPPDTLRTSSSSGSLMAGTWCRIVTALDAAGNESKPSAEICATVGGSSSVSTDWREANGSAFGAASSFRVYYGIGAGGETKYYTVAAGGGSYPVSGSYTLTTDAGTSGTPPATTYDTTATDSYYHRNIACFMCTGLGSVVGSPAYTIGFGRVASGTARWVFSDITGIDTILGVKVSAPTPIANKGYLWYDSTANRWKFSNDVTTFNEPGVVAAGTINHYALFDTNGIDLKDGGLIGTLTTNPLTITVTNAGSTGTTVNKLAKLTGAPSTAVIAGTGDTTGVLGCVVTGAGTTSSATIAIAGINVCTFDGATVAGDYVKVSTSVAGDVTDAGATEPTGVQVLGRVLSTNASGGVYSMIVFPPDIEAGGGGGGSSAFSSLTSSTNTMAAMVVGTGATLSASGSGTITATAAPFSGLSSSTNTTAAMVVGAGASLSFTSSGTINASSVNGTTVPVNSAADQFLGTTASATGAWAAMPSCLDSGGNHLNYNTSTHAFVCGTSGGTAGSAAFNTITAGTNSMSAMVVGTGASLATSGAGTIAATSAPFSGLSGSTNTTAAMVIGTGGSLTVSGAGTINATSITGTTVPTNSSADQVLNTSASATGVWSSVPACLDSGGNHLNYNTGTHAFSCGTSGGTAGSAAFNTITNGTNTSAAMVVGSGASLSATGSGSITATALAFSGLTTASNTTATLTLGTGGTLTFSGSGIVNASQINATTVPTNASADQTIVTTASATGAWASIPACLDSGGNHLNYNTGTHAFACGTSSSSGNVTSVGVSNSDGDLVITSTPVTTSGTIGVNFPSNVCDGCFLGNVTGSTASPIFVAVNATKLTGIVPGANGGTGNGFFAVTGPTTSLKTFTFPNASATVLTTNAAVTVPQGGTGIASGTSGGIPYFSASTTIASSAALTANLPVVGGGAGSAPVSGSRTGNTTQFASWTGATTASRCVHTDASGNLTIATLDCQTNPMTTLGDVTYGGASGVPTRLAGNTTTTQYVLTSTGAAGLAQAPVFTATQGGGTNPLAVTLTSPAQGDNICINGSVVAVNCPVGAQVSSQSGTSYTILTTDRGELVSLTNASAKSVTIPQANTTGFTNNFIFSFEISGGGAATFTATTSTITVNGLSAQSSFVALSGQQGTCFSDNTNYFCTVSGVARVTSSSIGGSPLAAGACSSTTATINGAAATMTAYASPTTYPGDDDYWKAYVSSSNTVTVKVCAVTGSTPTASTYNVRLEP